MDIYYFSGTGNSMSIALELSKRVHVNRVARIKGLNSKTSIIVKEDSIFIFPLYYYGIPAIVERFINNVQFSSKVYIGAIITAMYPMGIGLSQLDSILRSRGQKLSYGKYLKMPTNYVSLFKPLSRGKRDLVINKALKSLDTISIDLNEREYFIQKESGLFNLLTRAKKSYLKWRESVHQSDSKFIVENNCSLCSICINLCPVNNIDIVDNVLSFHNRCEQCYSCINLCPSRSIRYKYMRRGRYKHPDITLKQLIEG